MFDLLIAPFFEFVFLKRALVASLSLACGCAPIGVLLVLRRMSLLGDALSHAILPGVAMGYIFAGLSLAIMGAGGILAGLIVAFLATLVTRFTHLREDASFVGFYLIALAFGAVMVSLKGNSVDLIHILFGDILSVNKASLLMIAGISTTTLIVLAIIYRPLIIECFDPLFMRTIGGKGSLYHVIFMILVVLNLVAAFQALGTLMSLGMIMLPAIAARFWAREVWSLFLIASGIALLSGYIGLIFSYHYVWPSGPAISLVAGGFYIVSLCFGYYGSLRQAVLHPR